MSDLPKRFTIAVDFDGVINDYFPPFRGDWDTPHPPIDKAIGWLASTLQHYNIAIMSCRCNTWRGRRAIRKWLKKHCPTNLWDDCFNYAGKYLRYGLKNIVVKKGKPLASIYLDDRAYRFTGPDSFPTLDQIKSAVPWNRTW
jgi:hypothetical protein